MRRRANLITLALGFTLVLVTTAPGQVVRPDAPYAGPDRIEDWKGKTVLFVTPHPDDDTFSAGGLLAKLARGGNKIIILIYTNDNAGSDDPEMTHERLAAIRKAEEEDACAILGISKKSIVWLGYDDGMLEYVDAKELTKRVVREIRRYRPDAIFSIDPGAPYQQWHKSDHRAAAYVTVDAMRAAGWRLYFPDLEAAGFKAWSVPVQYFYYSAQPNYTVDITDVSDLKAKAAAAHISQFGKMVEKYDPNITQEQRDKLAAQLENMVPKENAKHVERFRRATDYAK